MTDPIGPLRAALAGRYEFERKIGQGAFATVYLARDARHERRVAVKVLNADPASEIGELRFIREIRLLARLQHPNILPLHDSGHVDALLYYVMPYVSGETLRARMDRERQLPIDAAVCIAREAADALGCAHAQSIVHRDIKPENILLSGGHAIVADFGIARAIDIAGVRQLTRSGMGGAGTPAYMSPEQLMGDGEIDGRSDIYSLACVLFEMLTGKPPFQGKDGFARRFTGPPPSPSSLRSDLPAWLETIVVKALARSPGDRYATAAELVRTLSLSGSPSAASFPGSAETRESHQRVPVAVEPELKKSPAVTATRVRELDQPSIGVLPFANMSADPANEYFSDGITEDILGALARIPTLKVAARSSSLALKGKSLNIAEIGKQLNVKTVLEGSVRRVGQRVRINVQLVSTADGYHLWSERYDREVEDVFAIQDEIARTIVERLRVRLTRAQTEALGKRHTANVEAYELYLRGRHCWYRWNFSGMMEKAILHFEEALTKDPEYALAYHGLADAYSILALYGFLRPSEVMGKAMDAAKRAVELAPELAETHTSLGIVQLLGWHRADAELTLQEAIDLNPRYGLAHIFRAWLLSNIGRQTDALEAARIGQELDPLSPAMNAVAALVSYHGRKYDQAIRESERALERDPTSFLGLLSISLSYAAKGIYPDAIGHAERGLSHSPEVNFLRGLVGAVYAMAGHREAAQGVLADLFDRSRRMYVSPTLFAWIYCNLDERDSAFEWLAKGCEDRACTLGLEIRLPLYDRISSDPRFDQIVARVGLN